MKSLLVPLTPPFHGIKTAKTFWPPFVNEYSTFAKLYVVNLLLNNGMDWLVYYGDGKQAESDGLTL